MADPAQTKPDPAQTKTCPRCKKTKPADAYHRNRTNTDGLASECRYCKSRRASAAYHARKSPGHDRHQALSDVRQDQAKDQVSPEPQ